MAAACRFLIYSIVIHLACCKDIIATLYLFLLIFSDCGTFPEIANGNKIILEDKLFNSTHNIEVRVEYNCSEGYVYNLDESIITCNADFGLKNSVGECVKGSVWVILTIYKVIFLTWPTGFDSKQKHTKRLAPIVLYILVVWWKFYKSKFSIFWKLNSMPIIAKRTGKRKSYYKKSKKIQL